MSSRSLSAAIAVTWLVTAAWDFVCASMLNVFAYGSTFSRLWQGVAATVLGPGAVKMGARGVAAGLVLHLLVALVWATVFVVAVARSNALRRALVRPVHAIAVAAVYGPVIWLVMSLLVIPLTTGRPPAFGFRWWVQIVAHVPFVTLPLVFTARRALAADAHDRVNSVRRAPATLSTARLSLRRPQLADATAVFEFASDPVVVRYVDWPAAADAADVVRATERALQNWESGGEYSWRVTVPPDDTAIGSVGCRIQGEYADFGFVLNRRYWGRGYATEAGGAVLDWLKSLDAITRIVATCDVENAASARVLEKLGLSREARLPQYAVRPNMPGAPRRDAFLYSWTRGGTSWSSRDSFDSSGRESSPRRSTDAGRAAN